LVRPQHVGNPNRHAAVVFVKLGGTEARKVVVGQLLGHRPGNRNGVDAQVHGVAHVFAVAHRRKHDLRSVTVPLLEGNNGIH
jgi:hypothetical protein